MKEGLTERAFREGYNEGYRNGGSDTSNFEFGGGSRSISAKQKDQDEAWENSDTKKDVSEMTPAQYPRDVTGPLTRDGEASEPPAVAQEGPTAVERAANYREVERKFKSGEIRPLVPQERPTPRTGRFYKGEKESDDEIFARQLERELAEAKERLAKLPADWSKDSSLETWFPYTAEELKGWRETKKSQADEIERLRGWKEEALKVLPDWQEIGKIMREAGYPITIGETVHDKLIPFLKSIVNDK